MPNSQFQPATLSLGVTMENVDLKATNVMVLMTVVITVMKRDVVCSDVDVCGQMQRVMIQR